MDLTNTIIPKSNQLNADDFLAMGSLTIKITEVKGSTEPQQPVVIHYEGDNGKPYLPGKSMRRVLVGAWGKDSKNYIGRSLTLYRDDNVVFAGVNVGGIRIAAMSHIDKPITMALTASKASRKPFTVQPLVPSATANTTVAKSELTPNHAKWAGALKALKDGTTDMEKIKAAYVVSPENEILLMAK